MGRGRTVFLADMGLGNVFLSCGCETALLVPLEPWTGRFLGAFLRPFGGAVLICSRFTVGLVLEGCGYDSL